MPGVSKSAGTVEAGGSSTGDPDRSGVKLSLSSHPVALSSSGSDYYMEMAVRAVHASRVVSEPGSDESAYKHVPDVCSSARKSSLGPRSGDEYMSMQVSHDAGYVDTKNVPPHRSAGWSAGGDI